VQFLVPNGGRVGGCKGAIEGGVSGQMAGGHIGGKSSDDSQSGFISPLMQRQTQAALELTEISVKAINVKINFI